MNYQKQKEKKLGVIILSILFISLSLGAYFIYEGYKKDTSVQGGDLALPYKVNGKKTELQSIKTSNQNDKIAETIIEKGEPLPDYVNLSVPFITQAPFRLWTTYPFNHTCEEASVLMMHYYLTGKKEVDENITKKELLSLVDFQNKKYGFSDDTNIAETARFIEDYYGYQVKVFYDISLDDIKRELALGNPVIVPTAGKLLFNPYFTPPGPVYHMLLIKGYNKTGFIAHDPGTYKAGTNYEYSFEVLEKAIHDFNQETKLADGKKAMIVVSL